MSSPHEPAAPTQGQRSSLAGQFAGVFAYTRRAIGLVWSTSRPLTLGLAVLTLVAGVLPAAMAWVGQLIVDAVVAAIDAGRRGVTPDTGVVLAWVALEALAAAVLTGAQRGIALSQSLLRVLLGQRINVLILEKALTLQLGHFEDSELYDKLTRARREASMRPLSLVNRSIGLVQNSISLVSYAILLVHFSPVALAVLVIAGLPAFVAEAKFSGDAFRLFRWRAPESRMQAYLETVLAREDSAKEVQLYQLGPKLLERYRGIFDKLYGEDRRLTVRRDTWGYLLGLIGTAAFYGAYAWVVLVTIAGHITLGQMTMYILLFKQGQAAVAACLSAVSGMYEDNLYLSNLYEYLELDVPQPAGQARQGPRPGDGIRFENVSFAYPGTAVSALADVSLHVPAGSSLALVGENGSGKTTLIKLLTRLYTPTRGRILLDGLDLEAWDTDTLRRRIGVIFQDFIRYQLIVGENIGAGDVTRFDDESRWREAADRGMAAPFVEQLPRGYRTQLGRWFLGGLELSGGQWQKIALARAFMRSSADILVLDEPTAAMDAEAEAGIFEHFRQLTRDRIAILISHRFSTVRMAGHIVVLHHGRIVEQGSHASLMRADGRYAHLFRLQAAGYQ
ncbi:MAG: ABC transporter ATP-binding protein [Gammaproteobacteria bacterium]|nr:ABC transporter ATP-binding protein [Gammaproteobacteria bacterium]